MIDLAVLALVRQEIHDRLTHSARNVSIPECLDLVDAALAKVTERIIVDRLVSIASVPLHGDPP